LLNYFTYHGAAGTVSIAKLFFGWETLTRSELAVHDLSLESFDNIGASVSHEFSKSGALCERLKSHDIVISGHIEGGSIFAPSAICGTVSSKDTTEEFTLGAYDKDSTWTGAPNVPLSIGFNSVW
jgi:hypothetical protein